MRPRAAASSFSVIVPVWNRADVIRRCLDSALAQEPAPLEVIVVDDGSGDGTPDVVKALRDDRVRLITDVHRGVSIARNTGVGNARGRYVTFLDSDDEALPGWLRAFEDLFTQPGCAVACCGAEDVTVVDGWRRVRRPEDLGATFDDRVALFLPGTYAVRRDVLQEIGGFAAGMRYGEHHELGMRLTTYCRECGLDIRSVTEPFVRRHRAADARERSRGYREARYESVMYLLSEHPDQMSRSPAWLANHLAVAGVSAVAMGEAAEGRRLLRQAIRVQPGVLRNYVRLAMSLVPPLARSRW